MTLPGTLTGVVEAPECQALESARRWTLLIFMVVGVATQVAATFLTRASIGPVQVVMTGVAAVCGAVGWYLSRHNFGLWLISIGAWAAVLGNLFPGATGPWLFINSLAIYGAISIGLIATRPVAMALACVLPLALHASWAANPQSVIATGYAAWGGWIPPIQVCSLVLAMSFLWHRLHRNAALADVAYIDNMAEEARAIARRARERARRRTTVAIHESLLNDIRSVLTMRRGGHHVGTPSPQHPQREEPNPQELTARSLLDTVQQETGIGRKATLEGAGETPLSAEAYGALRAAVVELVRNAQRHAGSGEPALHMSVQRDQICVVVEGGFGAEFDAPSGIGLLTTVQRGLSDVGGTYERVTGGSLVSVPTGRHLPPLELGYETVFGKSRIMLTLILAAIAGSGVLYFAALVTDEQLNPSVILAFLLAVTGGAAALLVSWRGRMLRARSAIGLALIPIALVWFAIDAFGPACSDQSLTVASALNVTGFMVIVVLTWYRWWLVSVGVLLWGVSIWGFASLTPPGCGEHVLIPALNSLLFLPAIVAGTLVTAHSFARAQRMREQIRTNRVAEDAAIEMEREVNADLESLVSEATAILARCSGADGLAQADALALRQVEGRIRIAVQIDRTTSGALGRLLIDLVNQACVLGNYVAVKGIEISPDPRPISEPVREFLAAALIGRDPLLSAFTDGGCNYVSIVSSIPEDDLPWPGMSSSGILDDIEIYIDRAAGAAHDERVVFFLSRPLEVEATYSIQPSSFATR